MDKRVYGNIQYNGQLENRDSNVSGCPNDRKSTFGYIFMFVRGKIS